MWILYKINIYLASKSLRQHHSINEYIYIYDKNPPRSDTTPGTRERRSIGEPHMHPRAPLYRPTYGDTTRRYDTAPGTRERRSIGEPHMHPRAPLYRPTCGDTASGGLRPPHVHPRAPINRPTHARVLASHLRMCKLRVCVYVQPNIFPCTRYIISQLHKICTVLYTYCILYTMCHILQTCITRYNVCSFHPARFHGRHVRRTGSTLPTSLLLASSSVAAWSVPPPPFLHVCCTLWKMLWRGFWRKMHESFPESFRRNSVPILPDHDALVGWNLP